MAKTQSSWIKLIGIYTALVIVLLPILVIVSTAMFFIGIAFLPVGLFFYLMNPQRPYVETMELAEFNRKAQSPSKVRH